MLVETQYCLTTQTFMPTSTTKVSVFELGYMTTGKQDVELSKGNTSTEKTMV